MMNEKQPQANPYQGSLKDEAENLNRGLTIVKLASPIPTYAKQETLYHRMQIAPWEPVTEDVRKYAKKNLIPKVLIEAQEWIERQQTYDPDMYLIGTASIEENKTLHHGTTFEAKVVVYLKAEAGYGSYFEKG